MKYVKMEKINLKIHSTIVLVFLIVIILFFINACTTQKEKIENLISQKKLRDAQLLIEESAKEGELDKDLYTLSLKVDYLIIKDSSNSLTAKGKYYKAIKLIDSFLSKFHDSPSVNDSVKLLFAKLSTKGAIHYLKNGDIISAYNCLIPLLLSRIDINQGTKDLVNRITIAMLNGTWKAKSIKWKIPVLLNISALTSKTFYGVIRYGADSFYSSYLDNCSFDILDIAATYNIKVPDIGIGTSHTYYTIPFIGKYTDGTIKVLLTLRASHVIYLEGNPDSENATFTYYVEDTCYFKKTN